MMKKLLAILCSLVMVLSFSAALAEETAPFTVYPPQKAHAIFELDGNPTTGYVWTARLVNEGVAEISAPEGEYIPAEHLQGAMGVGGTYRFDVTAVAPGEAIVVFTYGRAWENEVDQEKAYLLIVLEDGTMEIRDLGDSAPLMGTIVSVDEKEHTALVETEAQGQVLCRFPAEMTLPVADENVKIWFNGIMTMSLPGQINVMGWETIAPENARPQ